MNGDENLMEIDTDEQPLGGQDRESQGDQPADANDKGDGKGKPVEKPDDTLKEMRRALKETRTAMREANESAKFWMEQARRGGPTPAKDEPKETKVTVDLVEAITNGDAKTIAKGLRELGVAFDRDVDGKIHAARQGIGQDAELYGRFPDLEDEKSPLFKETAKIYADLERRDPQLAKSGLLAEIAAELADKRLGGADVRDEPQRGRKARSEEYEADVDEDEDDDAAERERDRIARVRAQSGGRPRGARRSGDGTGGGRDDEALNATQKSIVAKLKAAGADISEDGYRKRALTGVRMSGLPTRRPRY